MIEEKPDSEFCYELHIFREGKKCPELDEAVRMEPRCKKYGKVLSWTRSGKTLKCAECLAEK